MTVTRYFKDIDYDSELGYPNQFNWTEFKLVLKVYMNRIQPPGDKTVKTSDGDKVKIQPWTDAEWKTFKDDVKADAEKYLNRPYNRLGLFPHSKPQNKFSKIQYLYFLHKNPQKELPAFVFCGVEIRIVFEQTDAHVRFQVYRQKDGGPDFRSFDEPKPGKDYGELTNRDVDRGATRPADGLPQNGVTHELGHVLGLDHSNINDPKCVNGNERICYGKPGTPEYSNWMGNGNAVTTANAAPWLTRIGKHADGLDWSAMTVDPHLLLDLWKRDPPRIKMRF